MSALFAIYSAQCKNQIALEIQYRIASLIYQIRFVLEPVISLVVWSAVTEANGGRVGDLTRGDVVAYYIVMMVVQRLTATYVLWEYDCRIREGTLSGLLLRPVHPIHKDLAENAVHNAMMMVVLLPAAAVLAAIFQPAFRLAPWTVAVFVPALLLAFVLRFMIEWVLSLAAFWTTRISALTQMYFILVLFLSGEFVPLTLLPPPVQTMVALLPFRWMLAFPVEALLGYYTPGAALAGLGAQIAWIALMLALGWALWRAGLRRYSAVGA